MSFDDNIAIRVSNLNKCYQIYDKPQDRLKQSIYPRLQRLIGKQPEIYYREFWALKDVSFEIKKGETVGIIGRNGSGKSTLLQMICGTLNPTSGSVQTNGRISALLELGSGFNAEFTGRENIYLSGAVLGLSQHEIDDRFDDIAAFADIGEFIEQPVKIYSSGMYVRLAFAVQSQVDPEIFVVDEALAVGDEKFQRKCFARMEKMKEKGTSILFVSHSAGQISELCSRALFLERGERLLMSRPLEIIRAYQKLIYAPENDQQTLIEKFKNLDAAERATTDNGTQIETTEKAEIAVEQNDAYFDPSLLPETTQIYPSQGAEIEEIAILDECGKKINVLTQGGEYRFVLNGKFTDNCQSVYFGIHIRSVSGMEITGQRYPAKGNSLKRAAIGEKFSITFNIKMTLLNECYFVGGGVWSEQGPSCLHRVLDKLMFRINQNNNNFSFGYFDASFEAPQLTIAAC